MNFMRNNFLMATALMLFSTTSIANKSQTLPSKDKVIVLKSLTGSQEKGRSIATVLLSTEPSFTKVEVQDHGSFLQILLPGTIATQAGEFFDGNSKVVRKIASFQRTSRDAAIRLFVSTKASMVKQALEASVYGDRVIITIDEIKLEALEQSTALKIAEEKAKASNVEAVIANTKINNNIKEPAGLLQKTTASASAKEAAVASTVATGGLNLEARVQKISYVIAGLLALLLAVFLAKPLWKKAKVNGLPDTSFAMKTLSTHALAPKQSISLIEVAGQKILISVTPDQINYMTTIADSTAGQSTSVANQNLAGPVAQQPLRPRKQAPAKQLAPIKRQASKKINESVLDEESKTLSLKRRPVSKQTKAISKQVKSPATTSLDGGRTPTANTASSPTPNPSARTSARRGSSINVSVSDEGIKNQSSEASNLDSANDVTRLIREKLQSYSNLG